MRMIAKARRAMIRASNIMGRIWRDKMISRGMKKTEFHNTRRGLDSGCQEKRFTKQIMQIWAIWPMLAKIRDWCNRNRRIYFLQLAKSHLKSCRTSSKEKWIPIWTKNVRNSRPNYSNCVGKWTKAMFLQVPCHKEIQMSKILRMISERNWKKMINIGYKVQYENQMSAF